MKKILSVGVATILLFSTSGTAFATTTNATSTDAIVAQLQSQITELLAKITALKKAQTDVKIAEKNIAGTLQLLGNLREGMSGEQVKLLQTILAADKSIYPEGAVSGYYGRLTKEAVRRFQKHHGIEGTGYTGPKTLRKINELLNETPIVKNDDEDEEEDMDEDGDDKHHGKKNNDKKHGNKSDYCIAVPPGHLIASGWLKKHGEDSDDEKKLPYCKKIPPGIWDKINHGTSTPPVATTTPDSIKPIISSVHVGAISSSTVAISWTTNEHASAKIFYSTTTPVNSQTAFTMSVPTLTLSHHLSLTALTASTTHHAYIESRDGANNVATSSPFSFTTQ